MYWLEHIYFIHSLVNSKQGTSYITSNLVLFSIWGNNSRVLLDFSLTAKAVTLIFIPGCGSAIPSAKKRKSGFIYNLVKS